MNIFRPFVSTLAACATVLAPYAVFVPAAVAGSASHGTLVVRAVVVGERAKSFISTGDLWYAVSGSQAGARGRFFDGDREDYFWAPGEYQVSGQAPGGWSVSFGEDCDGTGLVTVVSGSTVSCIITYAESDGSDGDEPVGGSPPDTGSVIVIKTVVGGTRPVGDFAFNVDGESRAFWDAGMNNLEVPPGAHVVRETAAAGYSPAYGGDCDAGGNLTVDSGETATCTITNTYVAPVRPVAMRPSVPQQSAVPAASQTAPASVSDDNGLKLAVLGPLADVVPCGAGDAGRIIANIVVAALIVFLWRGRPRRTLWQAAVFLALLVAIMRAWASACGLTAGPAMLPVLISIAAWLALWFLGRK